MAELEKRPLSGSLANLQEPGVSQMGRIDKEGLGVDSAAISFAFDIQSLRTAKIEPNPNLLVNEAPVFHERVYENGSILEIKADPESASMGLVILPEIELKTVPDGKNAKRPVRLDVYGDNDPVYLQMGPKGMEAALASRAAEYHVMHNEKMHNYVMGLLKGEIPHISRSNTRSQVLEDELGMVVGKTNGDLDIISKARRVIATKEINYKRESHEGFLSRRNASLEGTLMLGPDGVVSSLYAIGGMPPVSGSLDSITTAAMSYMRSWIPRNGVFAGNFERQLGLFREAKERIESYGLPAEIEANAIAQIGIAVGCEHPKEIAEQVLRFQAEGGHAARIYTTNPDTRVIQTAEKIHDRVGDNFLTAVGPVTDVDQARKLRENANVRMFFAGHGGGENCSSLSAGGAANSVEILYEMYLDRLFNDSLIGLEGGTGTDIGGILPLLDVISMNKRAAGGIENTGGLFVQKKGLPVLPYHGSASSVTKLIEYYTRLENGDIDGAKKIIGPDGRVLNVEGVPNYMQMRDSARSITTRFANAREHAGRALADQGSMSIYELRTRVAKRGHNHVAPSKLSGEVAAVHRGE